MSVTHIPEVRADSRVDLHPLSMRRDGEEWIVGRLACRTCVALPEMGKRVIDVLAEGRTVTETQRLLAMEFGGDLDVTGFIDDLARLGFIRSVDGSVLPDPPSAPPSCRRLRPDHVRWTLSPALHWMVALLVIASGAALVLHPDLLPTYRDLIISGYKSVTMTAMFVTGWTLVALHELAHLAVARATGVPARFSLGTRLQFLAAQTDISGIELAPRRHRLTAYLAGSALNLVIATVVLLAELAVPAGTEARQALAFLCLMALLPLPFEAMVFMRTDLYYVLEDVTGCRDLYGNGRDYIGYLWRRFTSRLLRATLPSPDPTHTLPCHERRAVRLYTLVQTLGTACCLAVLALVTAPADVSILVSAVARSGPQRPILERLDGWVVLVLLGGGQLLWAVTKWRSVRRHRTGAQKSSAKTA